MVKAGKVYATATEDMDALTFGCNVLLRRLTFSEARKMPIQEFHFDKVLEGLELNHNEVRKNCIQEGIKNIYFLGINCLLFSLIYSLLTFV